jgi:hypothetical protein
LCVVRRRARPCSAIIGFFLLIKMGALNLRRRANGTSACSWRWLVRIEKRQERPRQDLIFKLIGAGHSIETLPWGSTRMTAFSDVRVQTCLLEYRSEFRRRSSPRWVHVVESWFRSSCNMNFATPQQFLKAAMTASMKRDKQEGPRQRGPSCLRPCCTFTPVSRCKISPALTGLRYTSTRPLNPRNQSQQIGYVMLVQGKRLWSHRQDDLTEPLCIDYYCNIKDVMLRVAHVYRDD